MAVNSPNGHIIYQHFPFQGPPKFTQIAIFGLKTNHLATLVNKPGRAGSYFNSVGDVRLFVGFQLMQ
jgi:hypothetical protein